MSGKIRLDKEDCQKIRLDKEARNSILFQPHSSKDTNSYKCARKSKPYGLENLAHLIECLPSAHKILAAHFGTA